MEVQNKSEVSMDEITLEAIKKRLERVNSILLENLPLRERKYRLEEAALLREMLKKND